MVLNQSTQLEKQANQLREKQPRPPEPADVGELFAEGSLACAAKILELAAPESAYAVAVNRLLTETDVGSADTLHRLRGILRAVGASDAS